jgi:membrane protease YdiL (CAAX protease family)
MEPRTRTHHLAKGAIAYALATVLCLAALDRLETPVEYFGADKIKTLFTGRDLLTGLLGGVGTGAILAGVGVGITRFTAWGKRLTRVLTTLVGGLNQIDAIMLALLSSFCEELLFRGIAMPYITLVGSALVFGLAHFIPRKGLWPWAVWAVAAGLIFGELALYTGGLFAPFVAHFTVNAVGLSLLSRRSRGTLA